MMSKSLKNLSLAGSILVLASAGCASSNARVADLTGQFAHESQGLRVEDSLRVLGLDQHDDLVRDAERPADGAIELYLRRIGGEQRIAVCAKSETQKSRSDGGHAHSSDGKHCLGMVDGKPINSSQRAALRESRGPKWLIAATHEASEPRPSGSSRSALPAGPSYVLLCSSRHDSCNGQDPTSTRAPVSSRHARFRCSAGKVVFCLPARDFRVRLRSIWPMAQHF